MHAITFMFVLCVLAACDEQSPATNDIAGADSAATTTAVAASDSGASDSAPADSSSPDSAVSDSAVDVADTSDPEVVPLISQALSCGTRAEVGGLPRGTDLVRHDIDLGQFPDALCNDGTGARFFVRPHVGAENADKWVIQLKGGGSCGNGPDCAKRWCSVLTNFGQTQMTADINTPDLMIIAGEGILERSDDNPWADYNHVYVQYCSSDAWAGTLRDRLVDAYEPCDPDVANATCPDGSACPGADAGPDAGLCKSRPVRFRMHFLGHAIVEAVIATLRRDGVAGSEVDGIALPDLDDADYVVLAGASAGGAGIANNLDRVAADLRAHNSGCQSDAMCPLVVEGLIDSVYSPSFEGLDLSATKVCTNHGACDYESAMRLARETGENVYVGALEDESCEAWHNAHAPGTEWRCADRSHVVRHHLTTPFFVRQGLLDQSLTGNFFELDVKTASGELIDTPLEFAVVLQPQVAALADWSTTAEEATPGAVAPGAFAPGCAKHETLSSSPDTFETTVMALGAPRTFFEVYAFWKAGGEVPAVLVADQPGDSFCAPSP